MIKEKQFMLLKKQDKVGNEMKFHVRLQDRQIRFMLKSDSNNNMTLKL